MSAIIGNRSVLRLLYLLVLLSAFVRAEASDCEKEFDLTDTDHSFELKDVGENILVELVIINSGPGWKAYVTKRIDKCNVPPELGAWVTDMVVNELRSPRDAFEEPFSFVLFLNPHYVPGRYPEFTGINGGLRVDGPDMSSSWVVGTFNVKICGTLSKKKSVRHE